MATSSRTNFDNIESELIELFKKINAELPSHVAELELVKSQSKDGGITVSLRPRNPSSASAWCHAWNGIGTVHFGFGEYSPTWELPEEGENPGADREQLLKHIEEMCCAVIQGKCEHQRRLWGITARLIVHGQTFSVTEAPIIRPNPPLHGTRHYTAYY
jgi:hypothetical protein